MLQLRGFAGTAAFADDEFVHRVSDGTNGRRLLLPFPPRAALAVVLLELDYAQATPSTRRTWTQKAHYSARLQLM